MWTILTIDTNIWAYYFDSDTPEHARVAERVEESLKKGEQVVINTVIVLELAHFLVKNLGPVEGGEKLDVFLGYPFSIADLDYATALESIEMLKRYSHLGIGGRDATILAVMRKTGTNRIMTHDEALKRVDWVEAIDPLQHEP